MIKHFVLLSAVLFSLASCGGGGGGTTTPANTGEFTLSTSTLTFTADVAGATPAAQNVNGTLLKDFPNVSVLAVVASNVNILANVPTFTTTGNNTGLLRINPISPTILGVGTYKATITIYVCSVITTNCAGSNSQIAGSPKVVNVTYIVTDAAKAKIVVSNCTSVVGDNTKNSVDGSTIIIKSHKIGTPTYKITSTRKLDIGTDVTMDYMVHEPAQTPKGIMVLIAGGNLRAKIKPDIADATIPGNSSGNFLVRSAHRYQAAGYRVITIDRPSDSVNIKNPDGTIASLGAYGDSNSGVNIDRYRHSMQHAVDIATLLKRENPEGYNVIISGTSRGSISAVAINTLASAITMSSPLTSAPAGVPFAGYPVGSVSLPLTRIQRNTHIMLHTLDACSVTLPSASRTLLDNLISLNINVTGNEVNGGFQGSNSKGIMNVCGGLDYHGFNGIENCAVTKETTWADGIMAKLAANKAPIAASQSINSGNAIILTATDADNGDTLSYAVPYDKTSLGGTVSTNTAGMVTYTKPVGIMGTVDTFAFTVTDGKGGVGTAVISITLP